MDKHKPLPVTALYKTCDPDLLPFRTTETLENFSGFFGQERAIEAMEFGVGMRRPGYNLFVMGNPHTGRFSFAMENLKGIAKKRKNPATGAISIICKTTATRSRSSCWPVKRRNCAGTTSG